MLLALDQDANHAERGAAQAERILVAGGHLPDAEHRGERFELVGERDSLGDGRVREQAAGRLRPVVLFDRGGHGGRFAVVLGVVAAHQALQFRKLADHVRDEVGLREERRAVGLRGVGAEQWRERAGERPDALDTLRERAELVVMHDAGQALDAGIEPLLAILVEEELGVGKPRAQHAFVAGDDRRGIRRFEVADQQEPVHELAGVVGEREVLLVELHRQDQALLRHGQECRVEGAGVHDGPLHQRRHFVEQRIGHDRRGVAGSALELNDDLRAARGEGRHDPAFGLQRGCIADGALDGDVAMRKKAMPGSHAAGVERERSHLQGLLAVQRQ